MSEGNVYHPMEVEYERGEHARLRERQEAHRSTEGPEFITEYEPIDSPEVDEEAGMVHDHDTYLVCPKCGSKDVESDSMKSYGGTSEGYEKCNSCGYSKTWADLSAVI